MTNEMVLERKSNLVMPSHYVELDREEMAYVDGGKITYYYDWDGVLSCISLVLTGSANKYYSSKLISTLKGTTASALAKTGVSTIFSYAGYAVSVLSYVRLALFGAAILAGTISMLTSGSSKIAVWTVLGIPTLAVYLGTS